MRVMCNNVVRTWESQVYRYNFGTMITELTPLRSSSLDIANVERALDGLPKLDPEEHAENLFNEMTQLLQGPVSNNWKLVEAEMSLDGKKHTLGILMDFVYEGLNEAFPNRIKEDKAA
jgi:hypothetical protein